MRPGLPGRKWWRRGRIVSLHILCNENYSSVLSELFSWGTHPSVPIKKHKIIQNLEKKENSKSKQNQG